ncbi:helix-turn-helix transcriptional regulator [Burkholderia sp. Ac-20379]|uniref:helix-turn-helix transcriptional regulator n=1 Tax=Burkholderia sp. Ac-20379 TaxID=2703900 RepID=UPI00197ED3F7|nr:helix-turn-helix transcriptional regulator [Burkholderia sp. Ac-20379]MBN3726283.1 helix-turn-helix transcriptional regulator [Burkholderia sp. Ac-20379]
MELDWRDLAFHHHVATLIDAIDSADFWTRLARVLQRFVPFDNWVGLLFARERAPLVCAESPTPDGTVDQMFQSYLGALYQLDPFYIAACERPASGLVTLESVAPDNFRMTDYYQRYFKSNIIGDEVQFNHAVDDSHTLIFSLGATRRYGERDLAVFAVVAPWVIALMRQRLPYETFTGGGARGAALEADAPLPAGPDEASYAEHFERVVQQRGHTPLTAREVEVVRLSLSGFSTRAISERLTISFETVRAHKKHIYAKLGVNSQSELFALFYEPGR